MSQLLFVLAAIEPSYAHRDAYWPEVSIIASTNEGSGYQVELRPRGTNTAVDLYLNTLSSTAARWRPGPRSRGDNARWITLPSLSKTYVATTHGKEGKTGLHYNALHDILLSGDALSLCARQPRRVVPIKSPHQYRRVLSYQECQCANMQSVGRYILVGGFQPVRGFREHISYEK